MTNLIYGSYLNNNNKKQLAADNIKCFSRFFKLFIIQIITQGRLLQIAVSLQTISTRFGAPKQPSQSADNLGHATPLGTDEFFDFRHRAIDE